MNIESSHREPLDTPELAKLDWEVIAEAQRRARKLRAEMFMYALGAPGRAIRTLIDRTRPPVDFAPVGTCP